MGKKGKSKYWQLNDEVWLREKYWGERLARRGVADIVGCSTLAVLTALRRFNIPRHSIACSKTLDIDVLRDKRAMEKEYLDNKLSPSQIAQKFGCGRTTVRDAILRFDIPRRGRKGLPKSEEHRRKLSEALLGEKNPNYGKHFSETRRKRMSEARIKLWANPVFREKMSKINGETMKRLFSDPNHVKKMQKATAKRPTRPEKVHIEIIKKHLLPIKYTGNGGFIIGKRCPDFIVTNGKKIVIEIFGSAFHSPLFSFFKMTYARTYDTTVKYYKKRGYKCIIFWDRDLLREDAEAFVLATLRKEGVI